jgi:hypothetical protein
MVRLSFVFGRVFGAAVGGWASFGINPRFDGHTFCEKRFKSIKEALKKGYRLRFLFVS